MTETSMTRLPRPTTLQVDLDAAAANIRAVRQMVGRDRKIFAVVKADGYGHGAAELGAVFAAHGADALAVADLGEGIRLRQRGITAPVLVYPGSLPETAPDALAHGLTPTLLDLDGARAYAEAATGPCEVFVKIDVGLERLGLPAEQAVKTFTAMLELPRLRLAGLCAHPHAPADGDPGYLGPLDRRRRQREVPSGLLDGHPAAAAGDRQPVECDVGAVVVADHADGVVVRGEAAHRDPAGLVEFQTP